MLAFFINIKRNFVNLLLDFRLLCRKNRLVFYSLIVSIILGLILSIDSKMKVDEVNVYVGNIIILIRDDNFNIFLHMLKISFFIGVIYGFLILAKFHFIFYMCNFAFILLFIRMMFRALFLAFLFDGIFAVFFFMFFWLPVVFYAFICYFTCLCKIFILLGYDRCKARPLCCPAGNAYLYTVLRNYAYIIIPLLIYNLFFILVLSLIF